VGLCLVALVAAGCGKSNEAGKQTQDNAAATSSPAGSKTSPAPKANASGSPAHSAPPAVLAAPSPAAGAVPATASPPKTGTYVYNVTVNDKRSVRRTKVSAEGSTTSATKEAERAESGNASATQHVTWTKTAKYLTETVTVQGSNRYDCDWKPDMIEYEFPLRPGLHWTQTSTCTVNVGATKVTTTVHDDATVRGSGEVTVAGRTVKVWVIDTTITNTSSYENRSATGQVNRTTQLAPELGLAVRYKETGKTDSGTVTATFELQNTKPS